MPYADETDLTEYLAPDDPPSNAERLLARASEAVDRMLIGAVYDVDDDGLPTDADVADALKRATLAQAHYASVVGDETGALSRFSSYSIGGVSATLRADAAGVATSGGFAPNAVDILRVAGLMPSYVTTWW